MSFSQNYPFREYTVLDGLPQSQSSTIIQDSRGFIWISTRNGLSRFDGSEFKNYFRKDGLPSNLVLNVFEDDYGNIWALAKNGLSKYNGYGFDYSPLPPEFKEWSFSYGCAIDSSDIVFLLGICPGDTILKLITFKNGVYSDYSAKYPALDTLSIVTFSFDRPTNEMLLVDEGKNMWLWKDSVLSLLSTRRFVSTYSDRGNILAISNDTVFKYVNKSFKVLDLNTTPGRSEVSRNPAVVERELEFFDGRYDYKMLLSFNPIGYMIDNEGALWFSSEINLYRLLSTAFRAYSEEDIGTRNVWAIAEDRNGHVWFGSLYGTLVEFDGKNFRERNDYKTQFGKDAGFFKGSRKMSNGDTWFSTSIGVLIWDGNSFSRLKGIPDDTQICYIYEDPDNKIVMLGTEKGLFILRNGTIKLIPDFNDNNLGVIEGITKDDSGIYWLSGHRGLLRFDGINSVPVRENILPDLYTYTIEKDSFGGIWVTSDEGLYFRRKNSAAFIHGLPQAINVSANSIYLTDSTHLLVGRISDICMIDLKKFYRNDQDYFTIFDKTDGFTAADCLDNGIIKTHEGKIWILTSNSVEIFEPEKVKRNMSPPKLHISSFDYETNDLTWEPIEKSQFFYGEPDNIKLERHQNTIRIGFIGISTSNPEKVKYRHRLNGYEDQWTLPEIERSVEFENLPPGKYSFQVIASNADGVENPEPLTINFKVVPAFWQTILFLVMVIILSLISTVTVTWLILKRYQQRLKEKERLRYELSRLQMSSVLRQFDPHFTFNVISSVGSLIMKGEKETAYDYILKLSSLLRTELNESSIIIKSLSGELDFVKRYCELQKLRFKDRFNYVIDINGKVDLQRDIPKMTIQTFVENSIKHGLESRKEGGRIDIGVKNGAGGLEITVKDNGIGREAASKQKTGGTGYGLKIITGIFDAMNENNINKSVIKIIDLNTGDNSNSGTEVKIFIPDDFRFEMVKQSK